MTNSLASVRQFRREHHPSGALLHNRDAGGLAAGIELEAVAGNVTALPIFENDRERVATKHRCPPFAQQLPGACLVAGVERLLGAIKDENHRFLLPVTGRSAEKAGKVGLAHRSEEHTSELQSR